jgi:hypothetical protein
MLSVGPTVAPVAAQSFTATIRGTVRDQSGAVVPGANITVQNTNKGWTRTTVTNGLGDYVITQLPADTYSITAQLTGFKTEVREAVVLQVGQEGRIDFTLAVGGLEEKVVITAGAPLVQSENAMVGNVIDEQKIKEMPLNGREFWQLARIAPNVFEPPQGSTLGFRGGFNVAGNPEVNNYFILDGIDNNDETTAQPTHRPSVDGIREFKVLTGLYSAEYGRQSGGQIVITTKSGTNEFHGTAFEFLRNDNLDARNFFLRGAKPELKRNQFGGSGGGPIFKDKTFFFLTYEGLRLSESVATLRTVPTEKMRRGDLSEISGTIRDPQTGQPFPNKLIPDARIHKTSRTLLQFWPLPNQPGIANNFAFNGARTQNQNQWSARIDHRLSNSNNLFGSYQFMQRRNFEPSNPLCGNRGLPLFSCTEPERTQHIALVDTHVFSPRLINEFRVGYNRLRTNRFQDDLSLGNVVQKLGLPQGGTGGLAGPEFFNTGVPQVGVTGFATIGGPTNLPQGRRANTYHLADSVTYTSGSHTFKGGADYKRFLFNSFFTQFGRGDFQFNGQFTGNAYADFLLGLLRTTSRAPGEPFSNTYTTQLGFYGQDDWKVSQKLTLNFGLRYELNYPELERVNKMSSFDPATGLVPVADGRLINIDPATGNLVAVGTSRLGRRLWELDTNNFAPRVGFAYRPFGDSSTVVRGGYGLFYNQIVAGNGLSQMYRGIPFRFRQTFTNTTSLVVSTWETPFPSGASGAGFTPEGIAHKFPSAYIQQWSFGVQREMFSNMVVELTYLGSKGTRLPISYNINQPTPAAGAIQGRRPYRQWSSINFRDAVGTSNYHGLSLRVERRFSSGLSFLTSWTFSKSIDIGAPPSTGGAGEAAVLNPRNLKAERGLSEFDQRNNFVTSVVYELPWGRGKRWMSAAPALVDHILGGWQLTGILRFQSGRPFTVTTGRDISNTGATNRPNVVGDPKLDKPTADRWFNTDAFSDTLPAGTFAFGTAGKNIVTADGINNFDLGLFKNFNLGEERRLQFRAEFFNLANHANFGIPERNRAASAFGRVNATTTLNRQIQFGLKFVF